MGSRCYLENREIGLVDAALTPLPRTGGGGLRRLIFILHTHGGFFCPKTLTSRQHLTPQQLRARQKKRCSDQLFVDVFLLSCTPVPSEGLELRC